WKWETDNKKELRFLCHLKHEFLFPDNFQKMNISAAIHFYSIRTASALETAVKNNVLHKDALSTAHFIWTIHEWFSLLSSKVRKTKTQFDKGWKPLNTGIIMATLSFIDICETLFLKFNYDFVLGHRFTQDALENIFSNIRLKADRSPTFNQCLQALKGISVSQYLFDINHSNYANDKSMDKGGLAHPSLSVIELILNCEVIYREHKSFILHNSTKFLKDKIFSEIQINIPICTATKNYH
ncbi:Uncharacterized protein FWK35_00035153, partial [Aphis craccivora]